MEKSAETKKVETGAKAEVKPFTKSAQANPKPDKKVVKPVVPTPTPTVKAEEKPTLKTEPPKPIEKPVVQVLIAKVAEKPTEQAPVTLESLFKAVALLRQDLDAHTLKIEEIQILLATKRKPAANGNVRVQIRDTKTGIVYKSKNNVYQTLLRNNELTDLISQGVFGQDPKRNSFGWYALNRAFPGRFIEIKLEAPEQKA
jgi:outer membrane biosynthesis protein TonB